jgi:acylglycerol lipase
VIGDLIEFKRHFSAIILLDHLLEFQKYMFNLKLLAFSLALGLACAPCFALSEAKVENALEILVEEKKVLQKLEEDKTAEARELLPQAIAQSKKDGKVNTAALQMLALLDYREHKYSKALHYLSEVEKIYSKDKSISPKQKALLNFRIAGCYYHNRKFQKARQHYEQALSMAESANLSPILQIELLEAITACLGDIKKYSDGLAYSKKLVAIAKEQSTNPNPAFAAAHMWSLIRLAKFYKLTGDQKASDDTKMEVQKLLSSLMTRRTTKGAENTLNQDLDQYLASLFEYLKSTKPETSTDWLWIVSQVHLKTLPVIAWGEQAAKPKAVLICIHGLGLDNRAFTVFGNEFAERGYAVYAMDVRGFGSFLAEKGYEETVYSSTLGDIALVSSMTKLQHPGVPVYLLGESMGGAIALRAAAEEPQNLDGVISAVPSDSLAKPLKISLRIALHAIGGVNRPFDIGKTIGPMATNRAELLGAWEIDPNAKTRMTPKSLMKYGLYLKMTKKYCTKIDKTPILMVQGLSDRLMSPDGTVALFQEIPNKDKSIVAVGSGQHLLFETDKQDKFLLDVIESWLKLHAPAVQAKNSKSN